MKDIRNRKITFNDLLEENLEFLQIEYPELTSEETAKELEKMMYDRYPLTFKDEEEEKKYIDECDMDYAKYVELEKERDCLGTLIGEEFTLCQLTGNLAETGRFEDVFETCDIHRDILSDDDAHGSIADIEGDVTVCFDVIKKADNYLDYVVKITKIF